MSSLAMDLLLVYEWSKPFNEDWDKLVDFHDDNFNELWWLQTTLFVYIIIFLTMQMASVLSFNEELELEKCLRQWDLGCITTKANS